MPFVQKADFRGECLKPSLLQVLGRFKEGFPTLGMGEHLSSVGGGALGASWQEQLLD